MFRIENKKLFINILPYMPLYLYRFYNEEGFTLKSLLSKSFCYSNRCLLSLYANIYELIIIINLHHYTKTIF